VDGRTTTIKVGALARVEGEGALHVRVRAGEVEEVRLEIYEPPRFFEAFLRDRPLGDAPDITSRICGICPIAYQLSACAGIEAALGIEVSEPIRRLRRMIYCGEWLESHGLHVFFLHAPDFLGYPGAIEMARDGHAELVERGLRIKKSGNDLLRAIGGRAVHPINLRVGGFYRSPTPAELAPVADGLKRTREELIETVRWAGSLEFPEHELDCELLALHEDDRYAIESGRLISSAGLDIEPSDFLDHVVEDHVPHSTALHARLRARGHYVVGPLARYSLNHGTLSRLAQEAARDAGLDDTCRNPFQSIVVRCVEMLYAADEALRLIDAYEPPEPPAVEIEHRASAGSGWTEAPRGMLWHRYELRRDGRIESARIVPPTSQNQASIEDDLRAFVQANLDTNDEELQWRCEQAVRNYDPCISCSTHFLRLDIDRG
jgi:coenzyme F420-reducing hydrogenase alpha subunit